MAPSRFISPINDLGFKKIFGTAENSDILASFLNAMIYDGQPIIQSLKILSPYQLPNHPGRKESILDIKAKLDNGTTVLIEMQMANATNFNLRILYNSAKTYADQLNEANYYSRLEPVIALTIMDFNLFPNQTNFRSRFLLMEEQEHFVYTRDLQLIFVELKKFNKSLEHLENLAEQWAFFLQQLPAMQEIPPQLQTSPALVKAFSVAERNALSLDELADLEQQERLRRDRQAQMEFALQEAIEKGMAQGIEQGIEQGKQAAQRAIAQQLLGTLPIDQIAQITGISVAELATLSPTPPPATPAPETPDGTRN